jgi:hypothetical protein
MHIELFQIEDNLAKLPHKIREASKAHIEAKNVAEKAKLALKVASAMALLEAKGANATEKSACAVIATQIEQLEATMAQKEEALKECELTYLNNKFIGVRKIASLEQEQMKSNISGN